MLSPSHWFSSPRVARCCGMSPSRSSSLSGVCVPSSGVGVVTWTPRSVPEPGDARRHPLADIVLKIKHLLHAFFLSSEPPGGYDTVSLGARFGNGLTSPRVLKRRLRRKRNNEIAVEGF